MIEMFVVGATARAAAEINRCEPKHGSDLLSAAAPAP
jgi:hypothetical protein